jgi:hypothetical protein
MPTQIEKLEAYAGHLLDQFLSLRERHAILEPMLFQPELTKRRSSGRQARGFLILRQSLFFTCVQDMAKLSLDRDKRTPSLHNLIPPLTDAHLRAELRERFAIWRIPPPEDETDLEVIAALKRIELREESERRKQFDDLHAEATALWSTLSSSPELNAFVTIRDKVSAHTEVRHVADKYQLIDIGALGIKWGALRQVLDQMQRLVELVGLLIRNAGFAWDSLDEQLAKAARDFWFPDADAAR